jgi:hypothetical protein
MTPNLTPPEHEHSAKIDEAARWYATTKHDTSPAPIPLLRERFGLTAQEACYALREASLIRARSG